MEDLKLAAIRGVSAPAASELRANLDAAQGDGRALFTPAEIVRVLGDPRDHAEVKAMPARLSQWIRPIEGQVRAPRET